MPSEGPIEQRVKVLSDKQPDEPGSQPPRRAGSRRRSDEKRTRKLFYVALWKVKVRAGRPKTTANILTKRAPGPVESPNVDILISERAGGPHVDSNQLPPAVPPIERCGDAP